MKGRSNRERKEQANMVLNTKHTTVAYRCPHCGAGVMSAVGLFNLSADMVKLKCTCGGSEMKLVYNRDDTVRLSVPCLLCGKPHPFTLKSSLFFSDDLFVLSCPLSDVSICFTGEVNRVKAELARTELELLDMLEEQGISDFSALHGDEETLGDPQVREIVMYVIRDLDDEGKIFCRCHPRAAGDAAASEPDVRPGRDTGDGEDGYDAEITAEGIRVTCRRCGASAVIPTNSMVSAHEFLNTDYLELT